MLKRIILKIALRLLDTSFKVDYKQINTKAVEEWAFRSFDHPGWRSYFAYEDLKLLKELSFGKDRDSYMIIIGRRLQLLYMFDEMKKAAENIKSREEKRQSEQQSNASNTKTT